MTDVDLLLTDARIATMRGGRDPFGIVEDASIAISGGRIAWVGTSPDEIPDNAGTERSIGGRFVTPALIDCHTHLVFGGDRADEFERRLSGVRYEDIAAAGGGILSTVRATRAASEDELFAAALPRLEALIADGVATVEIKSGYGLDVDTELAMLRVARRLGEATGVSVRTTLLAAHAIPEEFRGNADGWIDLVVDELLPRAAEEDLADAVDAYCESIAFSPDQVARVFECAAALNLPVKLHADQLSDGGGASLAARFEALSADHLEYAPAGAVAALADAGTVAVLLPGAFLTLGETRKPPVAALREAGVPMALATDLNPGTSPLASLTLAMSLGCRLFGLTPGECLAGVTRNAAMALGLGDDRGTLEAGKRADLAIWDIDHPHDFAYWLGRRPPVELLVAGRPIDTD